MSTVACEASRAAEERTKNAFADWVAAQSRIYKARNNSLSNWLAEKMMELAMEIRFTGGLTPVDHEDRMDALRSMFADEYPDLRH